MEPMPLTPTTSSPPAKQRLSDAERGALARFCDGHKREAFQELVRPHLGAMQALACRATGESHWAEDLVQESLVRAYRGLAGFRGEASLRTWLLRILIRLSKEPSRWRRGERSASLDVEIPDTLGPSPQDGIVERELRARLAESLERLTLRQRSAFHLRAVEGMDYAAIAGVLECSNAAARMLVLAARRKVMARMGEHLEP